MDLLSITIGIFLGAAFSPFWMKLWAMAKEKFTAFMSTKS